MRLKVLIWSFRLITFPFCTSASDESSASMLLALKSFLTWGKKQKHVAAIKVFRGAHGQLPFWLKQIGFELLPAVYRINSKWSFILYKCNKNKYFICVHFFTL